MNKKLFDNLWWKGYEKIRAQKIVDKQAHDDFLEAEDKLFDTMVSKGIAENKEDAKSELKEALRASIHKRSAKKFRSRPMRWKTHMKMKAYKEFTKKKGK